MRATANPKELADLYGMKQGMCQIYVTPESSMAGVSLADGGWSDKLGLTVIGVSRGGKVTLSPEREFRVIAGDVVLAGGYIDDVELAYYGLLRTEDPTWAGELASDASRSATKASTRWFSLDLASSATGTSPTACSGATTGTGSGGVRVMAGAMVSVVVGVVAIGAVP